MLFILILADFCYLQTHFRFVSNSGGILYSELNAIFYITPMKK